MCLDHLWAVRGPFQGLSRASTVRLKFPVFPLRYRSISSVWSSFLHLLLLLTVFLYIPKASNFPRSAPGNTQKPDSLPIPTYSRILNGSIFTYKWPFKFPRCLSQKTFTLCIWNNIWAVYIWNLLTRNDTVFIWSVENVLKKGEWKWSKKDNHIHKVPSKKMFCVRNSPTLTPSHSWKQLWTNKSSNTKGWNMLKNNRKMPGKGNSYKMRIPCLCLSEKPPTLKPQTHHWLKPFPDHLYSGCIHMFSVVWVGPYGCFWNEKQGFGGYVLQLVRVNLCPNASVTIGTGSQQSMAIGYSLSRRLSILQ